MTDLIVREATERIESREQPWFCYVPFAAVHVPVKPTQSWLARYAGEVFDEDPLKDASFKKCAAYASHMDESVGRLLESLERMCQRKNAIVVFASDNGAITDCPIHGTDKYPGWQEEYPRLGSNLPYRGVKAQLYAGGIRTPCIINWRSRLAPGRVGHPVQVVDWMPTLLHLTGAEPQIDPLFDGKDIWPLITGAQQRPEERRLFWNFRGDRELGVRHGDWKCLLQEIDGERRQELFTIAEDPYEERELSGDHPGIVAHLANMIREERQRGGVSKRPDADSPMMP